MLEHERRRRDLIPPLDRRHDPIVKIDLLVGVGHRPLPVLRRAPQRLDQHGVEAGEQRAPRRLREAHVEREPELERLRLVARQALLEQAPRLRHDLAELGDVSLVRPGGGELDDA